MNLVLLSTVFTTALAGSLHCAGMCGGLMPLYALRPSARPAWAGHLAYQAGRLGAYLGLAVIAGSLGASIQALGQRWTLSYLMPLLAGGWMILWGVSLLRQQSGGSSILHLKLRILTPLLTAGHRRLTDLSPRYVSLGAGLLSALMPCGWLYLYLGIAAGTGSLVGSVAVMGTFWAATLPALVATGVAWTRLAPRVRSVLPTVSAILLISLGFLTIGARFAGGERATALLEQGLKTGIAAPGAACGPLEH